MVMTVRGFEDFLYLDVCLSRFRQFLAKLSLTRLSEAFDFLSSSSIPYSLGFVLLGVCTCVVRSTGLSIRLRTFKYVYFC